MRLKAILIGVLALAGGATAASAKVIDITGVGIYSTNQLLVKGVEEYASAIDLTIKGSSSPLFVFCVDLDHSIKVDIGGQLSYNPPLVYETDPVKTDSSGMTSGEGVMLTPKVSGEIQTLTNMGVGIAEGAGSPKTWSSTTQSELTAVQGAIWEVEYGLTSKQVTGTSLENKLIKQDLAFANDHPAASYASGLYAVGKNDEGFGITQGFSLDAPEPSTWAMMLVGFGGLGAVLRRRRRRAAVAA